MVASFETEFMQQVCLRMAERFCRRKQPLFFDEYGRETKRIEIENRVTALKYIKTKQLSFRVPKRRSMTHQETSPMFYSGRIDLEGAFCRYKRFFLFRA